MPKFFFLITLALTFPTGAIAQTTQLSCSATGNFGAQSIAIRRTGIGAPYSLTAIIKTVEKLSDGNIISAFATSHQARDRQGRTHIEEPTHCITDKDNRTRWQGSITITDPVAKTYTLWQEYLGSSSTKIASVTHVPSIKISIPPTARAEYHMAQQLSLAGNHDQDVKVESLGKRNIAILEATGMRITRTVPAGIAGNSMPLIYVEEKWVSDDYGIILMDIMDNPVLGKSTYEVTDFTPGDPDASLFQPPADHEIQERTVTQ